MVGESYEPYLSKKYPPRKAPAKAPNWCDKKTIPNKELKYFVPKIWATIPLVGGTVESHKRPNVTPKIIELIETVEKK